MFLACDELPEDAFARRDRADHRMLDVIVLSLLVLLVVGSLPIHAYSRDWGYYPSGIVAAILLVVALSLMHVTPLRTGAGASLLVGCLNAGTGAQ